MTRASHEAHASREALTFVDAGRTFDCRVEHAETRPGPSAEAWWWFRVSSDAAQRFAPFRAAPDDTPDGVRDRIVAYYDDRLARRAAPEARWWDRRRAAAEVPNGQTRAGAALTTEAA